MNKAWEALRENTEVSYLIFQNAIIFRIKRKKLNFSRAFFESWKYSEVSW